MKKNISDLPDDDDDATDVPDSIRLRAIVTALIPSVPIWIVILFICVRFWGNW